MVHAEVALPEDAPEWADNAFGHAAFADALRLVRADVQAQDLGYVRSGDAAGRHGAGIRAALERGRARRNPAEQDSDTGAVCAQSHRGAAP